MLNFRYVAKDKTGKTLNGVIEAPDQRSVVDSLRKQELIILSVHEKGRGGSAKIKNFFAQKVKISELVIFSRQLETMIDSGIPLMQAIDMLAGQIENREFRRVVNEIKRDISTGVSFHEALAKHPKAFSGLYVNMVRAGESSGALDDIMERLASYLEKTDSLLRKVHSAMIYPVVVSLMAAGITLLMLLKVVPVFKSMFEEFGATLPLPTRILIFVSDLLVKTFVFWFAGAVAAIFFFKRYVAGDKGGYWLDNFKLNMPVFGPIMKKVAVSKFTRTLSTLVRSGVPILTALEIVGKTSGNRVIEKAVLQVRNSIREGQTITEPLLKSKVFPAMVVRMIAVGEQTGELEKMLTKIADFYDDQVDAAVAGLTSLIEPLIIAFLGVVVGSIVICMFLPIFKLSSIAGN